LRGEHTCRALIAAIGAAVIAVTHVPESGSRAAAGIRQSPGVTRFQQNPLITVATSQTLGGNVNGPTVIQVPDRVGRPLGRYYFRYARSAIRLSSTSTAAPCCSTRRVESRGLPRPISRFPERTAPQ